MRTVLSGISHGTELNLYRGTSAFADREFDWDLRGFVRPQPPRPTYPAALGYELVGRVEEVGAQIRELSPGDLVHAGVPHREDAVLDFDALQRTTYPLVRLPADVPPERWLFVSLGMVALLAVHDGGIKVGDHVAVFGLGAIGLLVAQLARLAGAGRVTGVDPVAARRELTAALSDAVAAAGLGATVVTVGFYQGGAPELRLGEEWHHNRLDMVSSMGAWGAPHRAYPAWDRLRVARTVVDLLTADRLQVDSLPIRSFPFEDAVEAYGWLDAHPDEAIKVALTYEGADTALRGGSQ